MRSADEDCRLKRLQSITVDVPCLLAEKERLENDLAAKKKRLEEINGRIAKEASLYQERAALDAVAVATRTSAQNARLAEVIAELAAMPAIKTERDDLAAALAANAVIPNRIRQIDAILGARPVSHGFFEDILTDNVGISFHRFQMFVWTAVLALIFISSVYRQLAMPEFSETLLALMGISSGTYMGFMIAEPKS
jgi:hypothetical protein